MNTLSEAEIQVLIAACQLEQHHVPATAASLASRQSDFRRSLLDWSEAFARLQEAGLLQAENGAFILTESGRGVAAQLSQARPAMWYWYNDYYRAASESKAYATFCERVFGRNCAQHGFSDMGQLAKLLDVAALGPANRVLDLGCGNGTMAEYISDVTGAEVTGIDYIPEAIRQAQERARFKPRLAFHVMDISSLTFPPASFDTVISIDTLYFTDIDRTITQLKTILTAGGQMLIFYAHGADPEHPTATFDKDTLAPEKTPLGEALTRQGLSFVTRDFSAADCEHARLKKRVIEEMRADLEAEGNLFLYSNRHAEAEGVMAAVEAGVHARHLYHVVLP